MNARAGEGEASLCGGQTSRSGRDRAREPLPLPIYENVRDIKLDP